MPDSKWMSLSKASLLAAVFAVASLHAQLPAKDPVRSWKTTDGREIVASIQTYDGEKVILREAGGLRHELPAGLIIPEDREALVAWRESQPVKLPDTVGVSGPSLEVEVVSEDEASGRFVYRTPHFEFTSEGRLMQSLLKDVTRNFEATYELLKVLPWGIDPAPESGDRFRALLVRTQSAYEEAGGPKNTSGVYYRSRQMFIIPFESLGIRPMGKSFSKSSDYNSDTLVHELTHQMMHAWLPLLPTWVVEGTAEYTNILPLRSGIFRLSAARSGLRDYLDQLKRNGGVPEPYPIDQLFWITGDEWLSLMAKDADEAQRLYFTSYLLVYFFMHLDGEGDGARFIRYFRTVGKTKREVEAYRSQVAAFRGPDGRVNWPANLPPPKKPEVLASDEARAAFEKSTLEILLDGRTSEQLFDEVRSAYRRYGLRL